MWRKEGRAEPCVHIVIIKTERLAGPSCFGDKQVFSLAKAQSQESGER